MRQASSEARRRSGSSVLDDVVTRPRHHERRRGADVEGVLAVAARAHDVDGPVVREVRRTAHFEQRVAEPGQLLDRDAAHEEDGDQRRDLLGVVFPGGDSRQNLLCLRTIHVLMFEKAV